MTLERFFQENPEVGIAFSGGVDSAYLLYTAIKYAKKVRAYYVKSAFQPEFELRDALRLAGELRAEMKVLEIDVLSCQKVKDNPPDRCYHCKKQIFDAIRKAALEDHIPVLLDGTNASDEEGDRPGMRAIKELHVRSPLRECDLKKDQIRQLSKEAGLFTWNKPAYACLATRIPTGESINQEILQKTERAEEYLMNQGFSDFRIRYFHGGGRIQLKEEQMMPFLKQRKEIIETLKEHYDFLMLDMECRHEQ